MLEWQWFGLCAPLLEPSCDYNYFYHCWCWRDIWNIKPVKKQKKYCSVLQLTVNNFNIKHYRGWQWVYVNMRALKCCSSVCLPLCVWASVCVCAEGLCLSWQACGKGLDFHAFSSTVKPHQRHSLHNKSMSAVSRTGTHSLSLSLSLSLTHSC